MDVRPRRRKVSREKCSFNTSQYAEAEQATRDANASILDLSRESQETANALSENKPQLKSLNWSPRVVAYVPRAKARRPE